MYNELIDELRHYFNDVPLVLQAADAIEELSAKYQKALSDLVKQAEPPKEK